MAHATRRMNLNPLQNWLNHPDDACASRKILAHLLRHVLRQVTPGNHLDGESGRSVYGGTVEDDRLQMLGGDESHIRIADCVRTKPEIHLNDNFADPVRLHKFAQAAGDSVPNAVMQKSRGRLHHELAFVQLIVCALLLRELQELVKGQSGSCAHMSALMPVV